MRFELGEKLQGPSCELALSQQEPPGENGYSVTQLRQPEVFAHEAEQAATEAAGPDERSQPARSTTPPRPVANEAQ